MIETRSSSSHDAAPDPAAQATDQEIDETLIDLMVEQSISDRLRTVCRYVNALARFRPL